MDLGFVETVDLRLDVASANVDGVPDVFVARDVYIVLRVVVILVRVLHVLCFGGLVGSFLKHHFHLPLGRSVAILLDVFLPGFVVVPEIELLGPVVRFETLVVIHPLVGAVVPVSRVLIDRLREVEIYLGVLVSSHLRLVGHSLFNQYAVLAHELDYRFARELSLRYAGQKLLEPQPQ